MCNAIDPSHPDCDPAYKRDAQPVYPSLATMAANAVAAAGRVAAAFASGQPVKVSAEVYEARLATCRACEAYDATQARCTKCGCGGLKLGLATEKCPLGKWKAITVPQESPA